MIVEITSNSSIIWKPETEVEKKINEIANILKLRKGELPFIREAGLSDEYIDSPITRVQPVIINEIMRNIADYVSGAVVKSVDISTGDSTGDFIIRAVCEI